MCSPLRDLDIRAVVRARLRRQYAADSDTVLLEEFGCAGARVDLAVVNGRLHGFEIKSDHDNLDRFAGQVPAYSAVFDRVTAVVSRRHHRNTVVCVPDWWEIVIAARSRTGVRLQVARRGKPNPALDSVQLARLMWRGEVLSVLRKKRLHGGLTRSPADALRQVLVEHLSVRRLAAEVREAIKSRVRSQSAERRTRSDGSYTIESTAADYRRNLEWLLSRQSAHPPH